MTSGKRLLSKLKPYSKIIEGIAHPYRLAVVDLLLEKPLAETILVRRLKSKQSLTSHHLAILHKTGWIKKKRVGRSVAFILHEKRKSFLLSLLTELN